MIRYLVTREATCPHCHGSGAVPVVIQGDEDAHAVADCHQCKGEGIARSEVDLQTAIAHVLKQPGDFNG